jgi:hypothetical protein
MDGKDLDDNRNRSLAVYQRLSDRYQSHVTIMWQAPALGLAAEAFLLTVSLGNGSSRAARIIAAILGTLVALMSMQLMAKHRFLSRRDDEALHVLEKRLGIASPWEGVDVTGGIWGDTISSYSIWQIGLFLLAITNVLLFVFLAAGAPV